MPTLVRLTRVFEYVIGYLGLSSLFLGALEAAEGTHEPSEMWVWPLIAVVIPGLLGVFSGIADTAARVFSYWPLVAGSLVVDVVALARYRISPGWISSNIHWLLLINMLAIGSAVGAAWLVRRFAAKPRSSDGRPDLHV